MHSGKYLIYCIRSASTGTCLYVGQTTDFDNRIKNHRARIRLRTHRPEMVEWVDKYGSNDIEFAVLEYCSEKSMLDQSEIYWFDHLKPIAYGVRPSESSWEMTDSTRSKIRETLRDNWVGVRDDEGHPVHRHICDNCGCSFTSRKTKQSLCGNECRVLARTFLFSDPIRAVEMYQDGLSLREVGDRFGTSRNVVSRHLKSLGVVLRSKTDQPKYKG